MLRSSLLGLLSSLVTSIPAFAAAPSSVARAPHVQVELVTEKEVFSPGQTQRIGVKFTPDPEWHIYWRNPGDSGLPPKFDWSLPNGSALSQAEFPLPSRILLPQIVNFGYDGVTLISFLFTVPRDARVGANLAVSVQAKWLICQEECVPGKATLALMLPVVAPDRAETARGTDEALFRDSAARIPKSPELSGFAAVSARQNGAEFAIEIDSRKFPANLDPKRVLFFPDADQGIDLSRDSKTERKGDRLTIHLAQKAARPLPAINGVLAFGRADLPALEIRGALDPKVPAPKDSIGEISRVTFMSEDRIMAPFDPPLGWMLLFAFAGGLILNLMPCVLPVLSIKVIGFASQAGQGNREHRLHGWAYTVGILASFWVLSAVLLLLRAGGTTLGWGFQLQSPIFVSALAVLFLLMALNLLGVFEFGSRFIGIGQNLTLRQGYTGSFFTGVLTTLAATPCSAPFMGTALGFALTQPASVAFLCLTVMALGLALPYLFFAYLPATSRWLPRPGPWMVRLKQILSIPLFATVVWLASVVWHQARTPETGAVSTMVKAPWKGWSEDAIGTALGEGKTVIVNLTAEWCVTCKVNEKLVFDTDEGRKLLAQPHVVALLGDWTNGDPAITRYMARFGRNSVPVYLVYASGRSDPETLPQILSLGLLRTKLAAVEKPSSKPSP